MNKKELEQMEWEEPDEKEPIEEYEEYLKDLVEGRFNAGDSIECDNDYDAYIDSLPY